LTAQAAATDVARILIVDDQKLFRTGLAKLLEEYEQLQIVGQAADADQALEQVRRLKPDIVLMDLRLPGMDGVEATRKIVSDHPAIKVLVLTTYDVDSYVIQALRAGASGYVLKDSDIESIARSILTVMAGERVMATKVANRVLDMLSGNSTSKEYYDGLTAREIEILKLMAGGLANKQIAYRLRISEKTVRNHITAIFEKLKISDRAQIVLYAVRKGLIEI
jgi:DNA-binding NarL/FixJ family response regulator